MIISEGMIAVVLALILIFLIMVYGFNKFTLKIALAIIFIILFLGIVFH